MKKGQLSQTIVQSLMRELGADFDEIRPLANSVNPDALDSLFRDASGTVRFRHEGCEIVAHASGEVHVVQA